MPKLPSRSLRRICLVGALTASVILCISASAHEAIEARLRTLTQALATNQNAAELFFERAELYRLHQQFELAADDYRSALAVEPQLATPQLGLAKTCLALGQAREAITHADLFLRCHRHDSEALATRAEALLLLGKNAEAICDLDHSIASAAAPNPDAYLRRAEVLRGIGLSEEAICGLEEGIRRMGPLPGLMQQACRLELELGRTDAALARLDQQLAAAPRKEFLLVERAKLLSDLNRRQEARMTLVAAAQQLEALAAARGNTAGILNLREEIQSQWQRLPELALEQSR